MKSRITIFQTRAYSIRSAMALLIGCTMPAHASIFTTNGDFGTDSNWNGSVLPSSTVAAEFYASPSSPASPNPSDVFLTSDQSAASTWLRYGITVNLDVRGNTLTNGYGSGISYIGRASSNNTFNITNSTGAGTGSYSIGGGGTGVPKTRRRIQSPRLTGLVRSGAEVVVSTAPNDNSPPGSLSLVSIRRMEVPLC